MWTVHPQCLVRCFKGVFYCVLDYCDRIFIVMNKIVTLDEWTVAVKSQMRYIFFIMDRNGIYMLSIPISVIPFSIVYLGFQVTESYWSLDSVQILFLLLLLSSYVIMMSFMKLTLLLLNRKVVLSWQSVQEYRFRPRGLNRALSVHCQCI